MTDDVRPILCCLDFPEGRFFADYFNEIKEGQSIGPKVRFITSVPVRFSSPQVTVTLGETLN